MAAKDEVAGYHYVVQLARQKSPEAVKALVRCLKSQDGRIVVAAAVALLNRAFGLPTVYVGDADHRHVTELSDAELEAIALGRSGRAAEEEAGEGGSRPIH
jgi:hypothetical protein